MAATNTTALAIQISLQNLRGVRKELQDFLGEVKKANSESAKVGKGNAGGGGDSRGSGKSAVAGAGSVFLGNMLTQSFSALKQSLVQIFDPNTTEVEKKINLTSAGLGLIPGVGDMAAQLYRQFNQVPLGIAQGTNQSLNSLFGPAFQAFGAKNKDLSDDAFRAKLKEEFGPQLEQAAKFFRPMERGREMGSQLAAEEAGRGVELTSPEDAKAQALKALSQLGYNVEALGAAMDNLKKNTKDLDTMYRQITDYWAGKLRAWGVPGFTR